MSIEANVPVAAVDWGTSHLRIWLLDMSGAVLAERRSDEGLLTTGPDGFSAVLERHLLDMGAPAATPAIICGMAGSRQGWIEAPYVTVPAQLSDVLARAIPVPGAQRDIRIVPGMAQRSADAPDVMRGEETQLAGIADLLAAGRHVVCMPGTHSKWVDVEDGTVAGFGTWLTGELFSVLSKQSILRHAVGDPVAAVSASNKTFRHWLEQALASPGDMTSRLFKIRASTLLLDLTPQDAAAALSGLLIGTEIGSAGAQFGWKEGEIALVASGPLSDLYGAALGIAGYRVRPIDAETAVRAGLLVAARQNFGPRETRKVQA
ncbi:2-dehydro-3-deoxygalactonokinase [Mesorhizobium albiziae]|uniref:2-dehydro-3-deoxygalactonokinase n=1 Tax=Neomesorhizobium albiziae TaxID=335020 RepID=A0A1I3WXK9_9HYPH|nr:2-dehydro-3-deoxygalactonokinase [Mesorhizobium albiziae]GLS31957.1 2-dehydro-3-deoxygalactonokinase [Mesorhizobium albiziae]SFK12154.1 2-dehydro-3-deoxygalactonokinase [Mesorhizobium albiziae]